MVEHCECKVIILADEDNIGRMYANMNLEIKYITLLAGKKIIKGVDENGQRSKNNTDNELTIEQLKKLNEEVYSENYIYRDIKEKVIGKSLEYEPELEKEIENIIESTLRTQELKKDLKEKKEDILNYMVSCNNKNIRIIKNWLVKFEMIYELISKSYSKSKHYDEIFQRFMVYSIRVACAIGKNRKLMKWEGSAEYADVKLDDSILVKKEGYRFIDDLFIKGIIDKDKVYRAANYIDDICKQKELMEEENQKRYSCGETLGKLEEWYMYEDSEIKDMIIELKKEIKENRYAPQRYQNIIKVLVILNSVDLCESELSDISDMLLEKIKKCDENIEIENFGFCFQEKELSEKFDKYYNPIYNFVVEKNRQDDKIEINTYLKNNEINKFVQYCQDNHNLFLDQRSFINYLDIDEFIRFFKECSLQDIYKIIRAFQGVYNFSNLNDFYKDDLKKLKELKDKIDVIEWEGASRKRVKNIFSTILSDYLKKIAV